MNWHIENISHRIESYDHVKSGCLSDLPQHKVYIELVNDNGEKIIFCLDEMPKCLVKGRNRAIPFELSELILELI